MAHFQYLVFGTCEVKLTMSRGERLQVIARLRSGALKALLTLPCAHLDDLVLQVGLSIG